MLAKPKKIPASAGVYIFRHGLTPLYIGKALNLKRRLASYFQKRANLPDKIRMMLREATGLKIVKTESEIEAFLLEAELIKKHRPKYNVLMRDDKSYFYIAITSEMFPIIFITHQPRQVRIAHQKLFARRHPLSARYIGPFTSGGELKTVLKLLRRTFPYCTCKSPHKRPCLNAEIGRCFGYCCTITEIKNQKAKSKNLREYRNNIRNIIAVLEGKKTRLVGQLKGQMKSAVKAERYEEAAKLRDQVWGLEGVFRHQSVLRAPDTVETWPATHSKLHALLKAKRAITRIEGYDISNIAGTEATGSMVVFRDGRPDKSQYRKFRIKTVESANDIAMIKEVLKRRFNHPEWPFPQLLVIDGGKPQLGAALKALQEAGSPAPEQVRYGASKKQEAGRIMITALAKREEVLYTASGRAIPLKRQDPAMLHLFQRIRDESHRFARAYHHILRKRRYAETQGR